jgi:hypothetical protein
VSVRWILGWGVAGMLAGIAIVVPVALWVWKPPDLLSSVLGGAFVCLGWVAGAWWADQGHCWKVRIGR